MNKKNNKFLSSILILSSGTAFAQILNILLSPIVTRIYTPEEFGIVAIFGVFLTILGVSSLKFEVAIPVSISNKQATIIIFISTFISVVINILILLIIIIFSDQINNILGFNRYPYIIYLVPFGGLLISLFNISRQWTIRNSSYKNLSRAIVTQSIGGNLAKICLGVIGLGTLGLAISRIVTGSLGVVMLSKSIVHNFKELLSNFEIKDIIQTVKQYKNFAIYMTPNSLLIIFVAQFPIIIIGVLYSSEITGYYSLAHTIIMLPLAFLGDAIGDVFYSESARIIKSNPIRVMHNSRKLVIRLFLFSLVPGIILILFGPFLFQKIFGESWYYAGVFSQILSLVLITRMTFQPMNKIFELIEKQKDKLFLNVLQAFLLSLIFLIGFILNFSPITFLIIYSTIVATMNIIIFLWSQIILRRYIEN